MDKARDARRGASRFSPGKPHKLFFGKFHSHIKDTNINKSPTYLYLSLSG